MSLTGSELYEELRWQVCYQTETPWISADDFQPGTPTPKTSIVMPLLDDCSLAAHPSM